MAKAQGAQQVIAEVLGQHGLTDRPTFANERICQCGENVRVFPPGLSLAVPCHEDHVAAAIDEALGGLALEKDYRSFDSKLLRTRWVADWRYA